MAEQLSRLEQLKKSAFEAAENRIVRELMAKGVSEVRALEFLDANVRFTMLPGTTKVYAWLYDQEEIAFGSEGSTDEHLSHFARRLHLRERDALGGEPTPFGHTFQAPEPEHKKEAREKLAAEVKKYSDKARTQDQKGRQRTEEYARERAEREALAPAVRDVSRAF